MATFNSQQTNSMQVRILEDQKTSLQELFKAAYDPALQKQVPLVQRNLPKSFFVPPAGEGCDKTGTFQLKNHIASDLVISHSKAHSSPACLDATYQMGVSQMPDNHGRQKSLDVTNEDVYSFHPQNCPTSTTFTNGKFHSHHRQRHHQYPDHRNTDRHNHLQNTGNSRSRCQGSTFNNGLMLKFQVCDLPQGYQMAINENKQVYFLNHQNQETTWFDPRIPSKEQHWGMTLDELEKVHVKVAHQYMPRNSDGGATMDHFRGHLAAQPHSRSFSQPVSMGTGLPHMASPLSSGAGIASSISSHSLSTVCGPVPPAPSVPLAQVFEGLHLTGGAQHSHQGSVDSGVGQSLAGQSNPSANQTPEHATQHYDSGLGGCDLNPEFMEGITCRAEDLDYPDMKLFDEFLNP